jgi:adenosyl cobinamide kinase/adenosyl cobinamide phosphate guanylyltransferase
VVLVGGARAGKSAFALELAERWTSVVFVATAEPRDDEMAARIERHVAERPSAWATVEEPVELGAVLGRLDGADSAIVDCLTLWVANLLERGDDEAAILVQARHAADVAAKHSEAVVVVTNEVGLGVVPASAQGRAYRDVLGAVNRVFVARADRAALVVAGRAIPLEGGASLWDR